ncbi:MAG: VOC family protein, partial [Solirubrobacteraceae bacterium]
MKLEGLHHITMITGDARRNVQFYAETLGLRLVKKTVNFDAPDAYHLYFGDETGAPGSILTWFEFPGAAPGRPGNGMIHLIELGVRSPEALEFWARRLAGAGYESRAAGDRLAFQDYEGLSFELVVADAANPPLVAVHPEIPAEHALVGIQGARAHGTDRPHAGDFLTDVLDFAGLGAGGYRLVGEQREFRWAYDDPPSQRSRQGGGTVHHIAWASSDEDHLT